MSVRKGLLLTHARCLTMQRALAFVLPILWLWCLPLHAAYAASYTFRSDSFAWETASTPITWDRSCTGFQGDDDKATITFTGGLTFNFAGTPYSSVRVLSNGSLQFGADTGFFRTYTNTALPAGTPAAQGGGCARSATVNVLMAYWTDLDPSRAGSGNVTWEQKGTAPNRYVVVSWNSVYQYNTNTPYTFQIILFENGEFKYQYGNANTTGSNATIGVQVNSTDYTQYAFNSGYNANGTAIRWSTAASSTIKVAEYRMDEFGWSGNVGEVFDSSGNGHHGVSVGSPNNVANGRICRTLEVPTNASASVISAIDSAVDVDSGIGSSGSLSFWFNSNLAWNSTTAAMLMDAGTLASRPFYLMRNSGGALRFTLSDSAGTSLTATTSAQSFAVNTWVHVAATWQLRTGTNQSTLRLYLNGILSATTTGTTNAALDSSLSTIFIGDNRSTTLPSGATGNSAQGRIDELGIYNYEIGPAEIALDMAASHSCQPPLHHLEIQHTSGTGLSCTPSTLTIRACQDSACATPYTGGLSGSLIANGSGMSVNWIGGSSFTIPSGSSSTSKDVHITTNGTVTLGTSGMTPTPSNASTCNFGSPNCTFITQASGLFFDVPHHVAETAQTFSIQALRQSDQGGSCVPAFANVSKSVTFTCSYINPSSGTLPIRVNTQSLNSSNNANAACDSGGRSLNLAFNASGVATTTLQYADAGQVTLQARHTGVSGTSDENLILTGSDTFVAAPARLGFSEITPGPLKAGTPFAAKLTAYNNAGDKTPNFGRETSPATIDLGWSRASPVGSGVSDGVFSGSLGPFSAGTASSNNLIWSEVGRGDLRASLSGGSYLGSGLTMDGNTGTSGAVGRFTPHHFDVLVTPACLAGNFSYAAQPFSTVITARSGPSTPGTTVNYDGSGSLTPMHSALTTLSDANNLSIGSFNSTNIIPASQFIRGVATVYTLAFTFTSKLTAPQTLVIRATDADNISSSAGVPVVEGSMPLRSGRLRLFNAFGSERSALNMALQTQFWSGQAWLINSLDSCTTIPASSVVRAQYTDHLGATTNTWSTSPSGVSFTAGQGFLTLSAPNPVQTGTVDLSLNLGTSATDASCLANHPSSTGANLVWLRSQNGNNAQCMANDFTRDPSAKATFGVYTPQSRKTVHVRDLF